MTEFLSLKNVKKRDLWIGAGAGFLLSVAVCLFQNGGFSAVKDPAFPWFALGSAVFFGGAACVFALRTPWIPLAVAVCGTVPVGAFGGAVGPVFCEVLLPALLLVWAFRFFLSAGRCFWPVCAGVCIPETAAAVRLAFRGVSPDFFRPGSNGRLSGFWILAGLFCVYAAGAVSALRREKRGEDIKSPKKKKNGDPPVRGVPVRLCYAAALPFFACAAFGFTAMWYAGEQFTPYDLLIDSAALLVVFGAFGAEPQQAA